MKLIKNILFSVSPTTNIQSLAIFYMRLVLGILMLTHGWAKLSNFGEMAMAFPDPIGLGSKVALSLIIFAEFGCSLLLLVGLFSRWATIPLMIGMSVAAFSAHGNDPFSAKELPVLYLLMYVVLLISGPGKFSLDALINKKRRSKR